MTQGRYAVGMRRRTFTATAGTVAIGSIAGCSSDPESSSGDGSSSESSDDSSSSESSGEARLEVTGYDLPETASIGSTVEGTITVENVGDASGGFSSPLYIRTSDSDWREIGEYSAEDIGAGETVEIDVEVTGLEYINRYEVGLGQSEETYIIQTVSAQLDWGEEFTTPEGYIIRIDEPELQDSYAYENFQGQTEQKEPEGGGQYAFVNAFVKNETGQTAFSPLRSEFALVSDSSQFDSTILIDDPINKGKQFEGGELQPGIEREGWIAYELPADLSVSDLTMAWSKTLFGGEISLNWQ